MKRTSSLLLLVPLVGGCVYGAIDPGELVDSAGVCALPTPTPAPSPQQQVTMPDHAALVAKIGKNGLRTGYVPVAVNRTGVVDRAAGSGMLRTIYLNREGALLSAGSDDASHNVSSILQHRGLSKATIPAATFSDAEWETIYACVKDEFSRFNLNITDRRPETPGYIMAMFGGQPSAINEPFGVGGIAPLDSFGCDVIDGSIVYIFSEALGVKDANLQCEVAAQEIAHAFSLDHELLATDPMTYLDSNQHKVFQDEAASCGESQPRQCACRGSQQNSVQTLGLKAGLFQSTDAPSVSITAPDDGASFPAGVLPITVHAEFAGGVSRVSLYYQDERNFFVARCGGGALECTHSGDDYTFKVPDAHGVARFYAEAAEPGGNANQTHERQVTLTATDVVTPSPIAIAVRVDTTNLPSSGQITINATITTSQGTIAGATVQWTDHRGVVSRYPMCAVGGDNWALPVQIVQRGGSRSFVVQASDTSGNSATSSRFVVAGDLVQ